MKIDDCIFCQIIKMDIPSKVIDQGKDHLAFLDIFPINRGHTIVIPKEHYENLETIPEDLLSELYRQVKKIAKLIHKKLNVDGYNILQNNFEAAGQAIKHFHIHIIPRYRNDKRFNIKIPRNKAADEELQDILKILKN
ncbi:MAG: HIT domain-containing protein [Candidatus Lokiarchaeota archaeon]|nr:HIT domain-containing protein [Candidatus Lokiarchaeota archaeon]